MKQQSSQTNHKTTHSELFQITLTPDQDGLHFLRDSNFKGKKAHSTHEPHTLSCSRSHLLASKTAFAFLGPCCAARFIHRVRSKRAQEWTPRRMDGGREGGQARATKTWVRQIASTTTSRTTTTVEATLVKGTHVLRPRQRHWLCRNQVVVTVCKTHGQERREKKTKAETVSIDRQNTPKNKQNTTKDRRETQRKRASPQKNRNANQKVRRTRHKTKITEKKLAQETNDCFQDIKQKCKKQ